MRFIVAIAVMSFCALAGAQQPYVLGGGAAGPESGGLSLGAGMRAGPIAAEWLYAIERQTVKVDTSSGAAVSSEDKTITAHGFEVALVAFAPLAKGDNGLPLELVGRIGRERLSGDVEGWRTSIGTGVQYGDPKGLAGRFLVQRVGDQTRAAVHLLHSF